MYGTSRPTYYYRRLSLPTSILYATMTNYFHGSGVRRTLSLGPLTVATPMALLSDRIFYSAHDVFGPYDALTLTLTLCPNPPLGSAPGAPPNARYAGVSAVFPISHHVQKIKKIRAFARLA